jgi:hypothetical protein
MSVSSTIRKWFTPPEIGERYGVSADKVVRWIKDGSLKAINVAQQIGKRPRFRVSEADLLIFEKLRSAVPTTPTPRRKRKQEKMTEYF